MRRRPGATAATLVGLCLLSACTGTSSDVTAWPSTEAPIDTDGLVWAAGTDVHLPDGSTITLDQEVGSYVVAGPGVFYFSEAAGFVLATPDGEIVETPRTPVEVETSNDGRWLGMLVEPQGDEGPREVVVVDTRTGQEVVRSGVGIGAPAVDDPDDVDWVDLYEDSPVRIVSIVDDIAYVAGLDEYYAWDLTSGDPTVIDEPVYRVDDPPFWNPSHTWQIPVQEFEAIPELRSEAGDVVTTSFPSDPAVRARPPVPGGPDLTSWSLFGWLDDQTAVGLTSTTDLHDPLPVIVTCTLPAGDCGILEGTEAGVRLPLDRLTGLPPVYPED